MSQSLETFGKYILLEKLQTGGMAEIYLARKPGASGVSKFIAIKRILPQFSEQTEFIDMFKDEAKIAVNLSHANIVSIHEFGVERGQFFLAMDYVEGRNLRQILNKMKKSNGSFSIEQVLFIIKEVAAGLDHAHRCIDANTGKPLNIIHRDMSPQNVMVSFEGEVKVVDFGIAKAETQLDNTRAGTLKGKFGYMSPEQAEGQTVDLRTDIFALGIVLWELLANDRLFVANNEINTLRKVRDCQVPSLRKINPNIPPELERIVSKALARDKNLRWQTAAAFQRELSRFLNRHYPDFSQHDFSVFVKTMFQSEILESRKKMVIFSKLEMQASAAQNSDAGAASKPRLEPTTDESEFRGTQTENTAAEETGPKPRLSKIPELRKRPPPNVAGTNGRPNSSATMAGANRPKKSSEEFDTSGLAVDRTSWRERTGTRSSYSKSGSSVYDTRGSDVKIKKSGGLSSVIPVLLIAVAACVGFFALSPKKSSNFVALLPEPLKHLLHPYVVQPQEAELHETVDSSHSPTFDINVASSPSGAIILIDGKPQSDITPTTLKVDQNKVVTVTVQKDGHARWEQQVKVDRDLSLYANLAQEIVGKLDIIVIGSGEILINNQKVANGSPAYGIVVPANRDVLVSAIDRATGARDEIHVNVPENTTKKITLRPGVYKTN